MATRSTGHGLAWACALAAFASTVACGANSGAALGGGAGAAQAAGGQAVGGAGAAPGTGGSMAAGGAIPTSGGAAGAMIATGGAGGVDVVSVSAGGYPYDLGVGFEWPETDPPLGPCLPGVYEGTFTCALEFIPGLPGFQFTGPVSFTLQQSDTGEFLEITDGTLNGDANGILFTSTLSGQLDCSTNGFDAQAVDGTYSDNAFISGTFDGTLEASLERSTQVLTGTWSLVATGQAPCVGPWSATRVQ